MASKIGASKTTKLLMILHFVKIACDKERAEFIQVLVKGILIKWINVKPNPIRIPANFPVANLSVFEC